MSIMKWTFCCVCLAGLTQLVWGQSNTIPMPSNHAHGIAGYLDPATGTFTAKVQADAQRSPSPDATKYYVESGTWNFNLPITLKTTPLSSSSDIISCEVDVGTDDPVTLDYMERSVATTTPSSSPSCSVSIPYEWVLTAPTTDLVTIKYTVSLLHLYTISGTGEIESYRSTTHTYSDSEPVPTTATTSITIVDITL